MSAQLEQLESSTALAPAQRAAIALDSARHRKELADLVKKSASIVTVTNADGREEAHRAGMVLKSTRVAIQKRGKEAREDATAFSKAVIAEEKALVDLISPEEERVLSLRDAWDKKIEAERQAKIAAERQRVKALQARIAEIRNLPLTMTGKSSSEISQTIGILAGHTAGASFDEFEEQAKATRLETLDRLAKMETEQRRIEFDQEMARQEAERKRIAQEEEAARLKAEREEIDRQRAEQEARAEEERRRIQVEQEAAAAKARAEHEAAQAELKAERDRLNAELAAQRAEVERVRKEQEEALQQERERIAQERAELAAAQQQLEEAKAPAELEVLEGPAAVAAEPIEQPLTVTTEPDDGAAALHFVDIVNELLNTRTADEIRYLLEETLAKVGLSAWAPA